MEDYIRNAFKSLEDLNVIIEPKETKLKEAIEEEEDISGLTIKDIFKKEASYIVTHDFEHAGHNYSLFLEALCDGDSCDIEFEEFNIDNITDVLAEVLDSEHEFIGSLTGEDITLDTPLSEVISKSHAVISGEDESESEETSEEANERVFINGDPDVATEAEVDVDVEEPVKEEVLNESETLNIQNKEDVNKAEKILKKDSGEAIEQIVDAAAESTEDLKKSYIGSTILQCTTCKAMVYKDPDQVVPVEGDENLFNIEDECPHCGAHDGFERIGTVASLDVDPFAEPVPPMVEEEPKVEEEPEAEVKEEETVEVEPKVEETHEDLDTPEETSEETPTEEEGKPSEEDEKEEDSEVEDKEEESEEKKEEEEKSGEQPLNEEHCEIKLTTEEKNMLDKLTHGNKMDSWFWIDDETDTIKDLEDDNKVLDTCDAILTVADGTDGIEQFLDEDEVKLFNDLVARCKECKGAVKEEETEEVTESKEEKHVCEKCGKEVCECNKVEEEKKEEEIKLESFDEDKFDRLVTRYLKETYSNVKSYKTTKAGLNDGDNKVIMEGVITFKSEKQKPTKFVFEAKEINAKNQLKLVGINEMFSTSKAFTLLGTVDNNKLLSESLAYRYEVGGKKVRGRAESFRKR